MFFLFALIVVASVSNVFTTPPPTLVVLSFEDFHPQHFSEESSPFLTKFKNRSSGPTHVDAVFPPTTYATHFSISTGVEPSVHGVYGDIMFDGDGNIIDKSENQFQSNKNIVPIWIENQIPAEERHSAVMMWPGSKIAYKELTPTYSEYNSELQWSEREKIIVNWVTENTPKANLVMAYFSKTVSCHSKKELSSCMGDYIKQVDTTIQNIYTDLMADINGSFNMVILSDHGTAQISHSNIINYENIITEDDAIKIVYSGPLIFVNVSDKNNVRKVYEKIIGHDDSLCMSVNLKKDMVSKWNLNFPCFDHTIVLIANKGYAFFNTTNFNIIKDYTDNDKQDYMSEEYGYSDDPDNMAGFMLGIGPKFKRNNYPVERFRFVDVYPLLKHLLGLQSEASGLQKNRLNDHVKILLTDFSDFEPTIIPMQSDDAYDVYVEDAAQEQPGTDTGTVTATGAAEIPGPQAVSEGESHQASADEPPSEPPSST